MKKPIVLEIETATESKSKDQRKRLASYAEKGKKGGKK